MIVKSYDFNKLKKNWKKLYLFYGNNNCYKSEIIEEVFIKNYSGEIIRKDENQPWQAEEIKGLLIDRFAQEIQSGKIKVIIIPDIESVNYGRGVGYEIIEHVPPDIVKEISATKIREQMRQDGKL